MHLIHPRPEEGVAWMELTVEEISDGSRAEGVAAAATRTVGFYLGRTLQ